MNIDTTNADAQYWESVLSKHKLDENRLGLNIETEQLVESEERLEEDVTTGILDEEFEIPDHIVARRKSNNNPDYELLRTKLDSDEQFMDRGHQITKVRTRERKIPEWAMSDEKVRKLIEFRFSKWRTRPRQRMRAARWVRVIHLYYRFKMSRPMVAKEMGLSEKTIKSILQRILTNSQVIFTTTIPSTPPV